MNPLTKEDQERIMQKSIEHVKVNGGYASDFRYGARYEHKIAFEQGRQSRQSEIDNIKQELEKLKNP